MRETKQYIKKTLAALYSPAEADSQAGLILSHITGKSYAQLLASDEQSLPAQESEAARAIVDRLLQAEPIQYILGEASFYDLQFRVNEHTLIPRPETEELVELILADYKEKKGMRLLDVGTGSGCIALTLAKHLTLAEVVALDISAEALAVAKTNARLLELRNVSFVQADILSATDRQMALCGTFDCIVSNPPYVLMEEKEAMDDNVLKYEPGTALFVPDDNPLLFYRAIAFLGRELLRQGGGLYFEINARYGRELVEMIEGMDYQSVVLLRDLSGKDRIIRAWK